MAIDLSESALLRVADEERALLNDVELLSPLRPKHVWPGVIAVRKIVEVNPRQGTFPSRVLYSRRDRSVTVEFDVPTFEELLYTTGAYDELSVEAVRRMYVGSGLAKLLYLERLGRSHKLKPFLKFMSDQDRLMGRLYDHLDIQPGEGILRKLVNQADAAADINGLRLSVGTWKAAHAGDDLPARTRTVFTQSLNWLIENKPSYMEVAMRTLKAEQELAEDRYADQMSEVAIAAACPMEPDELARAVGYLSG